VASSSSISWKDPPRLDFCFRLGVKKDRMRKSKINFRFSERCRYLSRVGKACTRITSPVLNNNAHRIVLGMLMFKKCIREESPGTSEFRKSLISLCIRIKFARVSTLTYYYYYLFLLLCRSHA